MNPSPNNENLFYELVRIYTQSPQCSALQMSYVCMDERIPTLSLPWREDLVGNAQSGVLHGGVITTLIDTAGAAAVAAHLAHTEALATIDLRIDYMRPAKPGERIFATSECYRLSGQVAFTRTVCRSGNGDEPFALGTATYMRTPLPEHLLPEAARSAS